MNPLPIKLISKYFSPRPNDVSVDTIVIHSMYNPDQKNHFSLESCRQLLDQAGVSVHYLISRTGEVIQCVEENNQAWHAGESKMPEPLDSRLSVNRFSIGIELIGDKNSGFTEVQYQTLVNLTCDILTRHKIINFVGHSNIAPGRKDDPWNFDWKLYKKMLEKVGVDITGSNFSF